MKIIKQELQFEECLKQRLEFIWKFSNEIDKENRSLKYQLELKDEEIVNLKKELSTKDKIIGKLQAKKKI